MVHRRGFRLGPAVFVTAAFIGPGTVMTASKAGAQFGYTLLWAILFSVITAIVLQEMAARLGVVSGSGLAEAIRSSFSNRIAKWAAIVLVLGAILFGNSAYQTGNIVGAAVGMEVLTSSASEEAISIPASVWAMVIAGTASIIVLLGHYRFLQILLTLLVSIMGLIFVFSAIMCGPDWFAMAAGLRPTIPSQSEWVIIALIGTTVVPYNLFLHASATAQAFGDKDDKQYAIRSSFWDTIISISVGGAITAALLITASVTFGDAELKSLKDVAQQLKPGLGGWAEKIFAIGLFAAGLTSSITAPIAAAYATAGCFGWEPRLSNIRMKLVAIAVIAIGLTFSLAFGSSPTQTIILAQVANGLLLPLIAAFLIYTLNRTDLMGNQKNGWLANSLGVVVLITTLLIAARQFYSVWTKLMQ